MVKVSLVFHILSLAALFILLSASAWTRVVIADLLCADRLFREASVACTCIRRIGLSYLLTLGSLISLELYSKEHTDGILTDSLDHSVEHLEAFVTVLDNRVLLTV